jgi:adenylate kinase
LNEDLLVERISGRRVHIPSGRSYHVKFNPPKVSGVDDVTGEPLTHRKDDTEEALRTRLKAYNTQTVPILSYYRNKGLLTTVNADQAIDAVWRDISGSLQK